MGLPKEFLSIEDVADYLESLGHIYDLELEREYKKLLADIYDLVCQKKISVVFHYYGYVEVTELIYEDIGVNPEDGSYYPVEVDRYTSKPLMNDFFILDTPTLKNILIEHSLVPLNGYFDIYISQNSYSNTSSMYHIETNEKLSSSDVRIPSRELKTLFNKNNTTDSNEGCFMGIPTLLQGEAKSDKKITDQLEHIKIELETKNEQLQKRINELEHQLEQSTKKQSDNIYTTPAMDVMNEVIKEFWLDYRPNKPAPKQEVITNWITTNFKNISNALALNIDKVCRHIDAKSGGKYKR